MKLDLVRIYNCSTYCIGKLYVDGVWLCDTIEDTDRGLDQGMLIDEIRRLKVYKKTAIPTGTYRVTLNIQSPKFAAKKYYYDYCKGYLPRLLNVPGYEGILIHKGTTADSSAGCLIVGYNTIKGRVTDSQKAWEALMTKLKGAKDKITITISKRYKKK